MSRTVQPVESVADSDSEHELCHECGNARTVEKKHSANSGYVYVEHILKCQEGETPVAPESYFEFAVGILRKVTCDFLLKRPLQVVSPAVTIALGRLLFAPLFQRPGQPTPRAVLSALERIARDPIFQQIEPLATAEVEKAKEKIARGEMEVPSALNMNLNA